MALPMPAGGLRCGALVLSAVVVDAGAELGGVDAVVFCDGGEDELQPPKNMALKTDAVTQAPQ